MSRFFITTAIDYANGDPHLGHALEKIGADCIARYRRLRGDDVRFLMGMDEHGQKVAQSAEQAGMPPETWVTTIAERFARTWARLLCSNDDWIRTTEERHKRSVTRFIELIRERNPDDINVGEYEGLYCVGCEEFKQESQIVDGRCVEHPSRDLERRRERNYFFRLSRWGPRVLELIRSGALEIGPAIRRNEVIRVLEDGLEDISISRVRFTWGIPFPGDAEHTVYVWFDALINYLSATGFPDPGFERWWPADLHVIGKGISRLHCALWPAMLLSAELPVQRKVWAHGYVQWGGAKVSKSEGGAVSLDAAIDRHGPDALRYFLLREVGFEADGNFTWERFDERYTADLADGLGNLVSRSLAMVVKYRGGTIPAGEPTSMDAEGLRAIAAYADAMDRVDLRGGAEAAWELAGATNLYIQRAAPWTLAKDGRDAELDRVLGSLARTLWRLAVLATPFLPGKAQLIWAALGCGGDAAGAPWSALQSPPTAGQMVQPPGILFPKPLPA